MTPLTAKVEKCRTIRCECSVGVYHHVVRVRRCDDIVGKRKRFWTRLYNALKADEISTFTAMERAKLGV